MTRWFLLTGNRLLVSLVMLLGIAGLFVVSGAFGLATVTTPNRVMWYLNGTVNGLLTLVPISVGVNQIVLSHEFGSIQDLYQRRTDVTQFRKRVERQTGTTVSSPHASAFFDALLAAVVDTAEDLRRTTGLDRNDDQSTDDVDDVARAVMAEADRTRDELSAVDADMLRTLLVLLDYDDSGQFTEMQRLQVRSDRLPEETVTRLHRVEELMMEIDAARQYVKTVVVERQLSQLSRLLIYTGIFAVAVATLGIFSYQDVAGLTVSRTLLVAVASVFVVVPLVPLAILGAYILRVATIARRTAAFGPFVPADRRSSDDEA
ncbi:hypothetical protein DMJ13_01255 [halophilic archaeon]|nr:hypothetical protein DMJ13_01255 [halophilic archaeon]